MVSFARDGDLLPHSGRRGPDCHYWIEVSGIGIGAPLRTAAPRSAGYGEQSAESHGSDGAVLLSSVARGLPGMSGRNEHLFRRVLLRAAGIARTRRGRVPGSSPDRGALSLAGIPHFGNAGNAPPAVCRNDCGRKDRVIGYAANVLFPTDRPRLYCR